MPLFAADRQGRLLSFNDAVGELFGAAVAGRAESLADLLGPGGAEGTLAEAHLGTPARPGAGARWDAYCAMITARSYKPALSEEEARAELVRCAGTQFDPEVVEAFLAVLDTPAGRMAVSEEDQAECGLLPAFVAEAQRQR